MALARMWAGKAYGTNIGNLFVRLEGSDEALKGTLHFNDLDVGVTVYEISGSFDGNRLSLTGKPQNQINGVTFGDLSATGKLEPKGELSGKWQSNIGTAGTFVLFPHDQTRISVATPLRIPDQLHTVRHQFDAVELDRQQITALADEIQREFKTDLVMTVVAETEQSRFLPDFKALDFRTDKPEIIKFFAQEPEGTGVNRVVSLEFGPVMNTAMIQGGDEAWVLGMLEKLKRSIKRHERTDTTNFKRMGFGVNQVLFFGAIVFMPSLDSLRDRVILMVGVLALILGVVWFHRRYLPFAAIYLGKKPVSILARVAPTAASWLIAVTASVAAALLAAYLKGWLDLP